VTAEAKVPVGDSGEVYTLWFNDFERFGGTLSDKVDRAVGKARPLYSRQADAAPEANRAALREPAHGDIRFYRLDLVGTHRSFAELADDSSVLAVLPDAGTGKVDALREVRAQLDSMHSAAPAVSSQPEVRLNTTRLPAGGAAEGAPVVRRSPLARPGGTADGARRPRTCPR
jgi:hypothetical protein